MRAFIQSPAVSHSPRTARSCVLVSAALLALIFGIGPRGWAAESDDAAIAKLKNPDAKVRLVALQELQTSLDPRLPETMLALLADEGNSIRRLAARGVGSRWWQIPKERVPDYVKALKRNAKSKLEDEVNMLNRALGLLNRDYSGTMFVRSPTQRWVIYERYGLPCLIDTQTGTEELLGWKGDRIGWLDAAWDNATLESSVAWHPKKEIAALSIILNRKASTLAFWQHRAGLRLVQPTAITRALGFREDDFHSAGGFYTEAKGWKGDEFQFEAHFTTRRKGEYVDRTALLAWNAVKKSLRVISR
jgi:hypothetical protein